MIQAPWLLVLLTILAVARLTRLVTADVLLHPLRARLVSWRLADGRRDDTDWMIYLAHCRYCASIWIGIPAAAGCYFGHGLWVVQVLLIGLSASYVAGLMARLED